MPQLSFHVEDVRPVEYAAVPLLFAHLRVTNTVKEERIQSILLNCQLQIQPSGRTYSYPEERKLLDLFGERERWGQTMKPLHWMNLVVKVPPFVEESVVEISIPCSLDFDVAATKYFYGLDHGDIPALVMFSGTVFYINDQGAIQIAQVPWSCEAGFQLQVEVWKAAIDNHYENTRWLRLRHDTFDRLYRHKVARGLPFWDDLIVSLLDEAERSDVSPELAKGELG